MDRKKIREYPILLKILLGIGALFIGSFVLLFASMTLYMLGFAYGIEWLPAVTQSLESLSIILLALSVVLGGAVSFAGLGTQTLTPAANLEREKRKNEAHQSNIREQGLSVEDILNDMDREERDRLAEKLAESRLAIREDGILIPVEQAEKLYKIERFVDG